MMMMNSTTLHEKTCKHIKHKTIIWNISVLVSGLDPAGLCFGGRDPEVRLDRTDADYVDVIHTDGQPITSLGKSMKFEIRLKKIFDDVHTFF
jgi:hypothetical protein